MTSSDIVIISPLLCKNITIQTTQKIKSSNLYNFFTTSIQSNDTILELDDKIFYYYIIESNIYEIYILNTKYEYINLQSSIFKYFYKNNTNTTDLFITNDYFVVFKNGELYFFKENIDYEIEDIKSFIKYKYKININNTYLINKEQIKLYEEEFLKNNKQTIEFIKPKQSKFIWLYIVYLIILIVLFIIYNSKFENNKVIQENKIVYEINNNILFDIIKLCNIYKLQLEKLEYKNRYIIKIKSNNKKNINKFLSYYEDKIDIKNIYKKGKSYILEFDIAN